MRYLGIDYGTRRIGLSVSSEGIAFPRGVLENSAELLVVLREVITKEKIEAIVVGDTRSFGGGENPVTKDADAFIEKLKKETGLPVAVAREAGSSKEASRFAPEGRPHDDSAAATIILQRYLDMRGDAIHPMR
ncbi:pre-16S rRNA-processing nuclease YqgF [Candidatus Kaiserbacteria bacterium]|nr:pre-16S rRNA-processing nuclease YqgF [Candidatus Kaiserbacteria bacterium]